MDLNRYTKYFNHGYTLAKHQPEILDKLIKASKGNDVVREPLIAGELQYKKELTQARLQESSRSRPRKRERGQDMEQEM